MSEFNDDEKTPPPTIPSRDLADQILLLVQRIRDCESRNKLLEARVATLEDEPLRKMTQKLVDNVLAWAREMIARGFAPVVKHGTKPPT